MRIQNSFIPVRGVGRATERRLWERGITHWDEFDGSVVGREVGRRVEEFIETGRDRLRAGDVAFFGEAFPSRSRWRLYEDFREGACFFDIETTGLHDGADVTVVSLHRGGETTTLVRGRDLTRESLREAFAGADLLVTFNGKRFDVPFLERAFGVDLDRPHVDLIYPCRRLDLTGGLKAVEREVGIARDRPDLSGEDAVRLWRQYERGDEDALDTLVSYNRDDTENLAALMETVAGRLHDTTLGTVADGG